MRCRRPPCQARRMAPSKSFTAHASTICAKNSFTDHTKCTSSSKSAVNITALAPFASLTLSPAACPASLELMNPDAIALALARAKGSFALITIAFFHRHWNPAHMAASHHARTVCIAAQRPAIRTTHHLGQVRAGQSASVSPSNGCFVPFVTFQLFGLLLEHRHQTSFFLL